MIQANELRIGNWVLFYGEFSQVESIGTYGCSFNKGFAKYTLPILKPIPLSEEMLLKCGFIIGMGFQDFLKGKYSFVEIKGGILYGEFSEEGVFYFNSKTQLKYLHQLQNLCFALTNQELKIEL